MYILFCIPFSFIVSILTNLLFYIIFFQLNSLLYIFYCYLVVSLDYHINSWIIESNIKYYLYKLLYVIGGFLGGSDGKESACHAGDPGSIPGLERPPGKKVATHSSVLAWRIPWREEPKWSAVHGVRVRHNCGTSTHTNTYVVRSLSLFHFTCLLVFHYFSCMLLSPNVTIIFYTVNVPL